MVERARPLQEVRNLVCRIDSSRTRFADYIRSVSLEKFLIDKHPCLSVSISRVISSVLRITCGHRFAISVGYEGVRGANHPRQYRDWFAFCGQMFLSVFQRSSPLARSCPIYRLLSFFQQRRKLSKRRRVITVPYDGTVPQQLMHLDLQCPVHRKLVGTHLIHRHFTNDFVLKKKLLLSLGNETTVFC